MYEVAKETPNRVRLEQSGLWTFLSLSFQYLGHHHQTMIQSGQAPLQLRLAFTPIHSFGFQVRG